MKGQAFWICKRCGNRTEGVAPNQTEICWPCIERVMQQPKSQRQSPWLRLLWAVLVFVLVFVPGLLFIANFIEPLSTQLAWNLSILNFWLAFIPAIATATMVRCPCCREISFDANKCIPCGFEYQDARTSD